MEIIYAFILAVIQGISEWLPISSSAHLALAQMLMGIKVPVYFDLLLHFGTLVSAVVFLRKEIYRILSAVLMLKIKDPDFKLGTYIVIASIPTAIIGFGFKRFFESQFTNPLGMGAALVITGTFLYFCESRKDSREISPKTAFVIGVAQGIAVMPGISRSGATIGTGLLMGISREQTTKFSFLLSIPAIVGATFFEIKDAGPLDVGAEAMLAGMVVSAVIGYLTIGFLVDFVRKKGLEPFAYYCWLAGAFALALLLK